MGLESANYLFSPRDGIGRVATVLTSLGATPLTPFPGSDFPRWVLRSDTSWIDVMVGDLGPERAPAVSIRIALSNPTTAHAALRVLMTALLESLPGVLFDRQTRRSYTHLDHGTWHDIESALLKRRDEFQRNFGPFEAAISADDVFQTLRARS